MATWLPDCKLALFNNVQDYRMEQIESYFSNWSITLKTHLCSLCGNEISVTGAHESHATTESCSVRQSIRVHHGSTATSHTSPSKTTCTSTGRETRLSSPYNINVTSLYVLCYIINITSLCVLCCIIKNISACLTLTLCAAHVTSSMSHLYRCVCPVSTQAPGLYADNLHLQDPPPGFKQFDRLAGSALICECCM